MVPPLNSAVKLNVVEFNPIANASPAAEFPPYPKQAWNTLGVVAVGYTQQDSVAVMLPVGTTIGLVTSMYWFVPLNVKFPAFAVL